MVPAAGLRDAARAVAGEIAAKDPVVIRRAKESLNGIDPVDVKRSYRFEQGFTFELNLNGAGDRARQRFVDGAVSMDRGDRRSPRWSASCAPA